MTAREHDLEVLHTAMQIERDAHAFYSVAAAQTKDSAAVRMFLSLARAEMEHLGKLETAYCALTKQDKWPSAQPASSSRILAVSPPSEKPLAAATPDARELDALQRGMRAERDAIAFYEGALEQATDPEARVLYEYLIGEEKGHLAILSAEHDYLTQTGFWFSYQGFQVAARD